MFPGLDLYSIDPNPAQHLATAHTRSTVADNLSEIDDLDHDLSETCKHHTQLEKHELSTRNS